MNSRSSLRVLALVLTALALALPASAVAAAAPFTARLQAPNHSPTAGKKWYITVTVTHGKTKLSGSVSYQFLYNGSDVGNQKGHSFKGGVYHDWLLFPALAVGHPLTLRVVVKTSYGTVYLPWAVQVKQA
jgi:opacity protein-like surface antigen